MPAEVSSTNARSSGTLPYGCQSGADSFNLTFLSAAFIACHPWFPCHYTALVQGVILGRELSLAERVMTQSITEGMANGTAFYAAIGLWNSFFLCLYSCFNMSILMKYSSR